MAVFEATTELTADPRRVFDFLLRPANAARVSPPWLRAEMLDGPELLTVGAVVRFRVRRFGVPQTMTSVVTALEPGRLLRDEQTSGPFRRWCHTHELAPLPGGGTRMLDRVEFEPPGGLLGWLVTERFLMRDLASTFAHRSARFRELL